MGNFRFQSKDHFLNYCKKIILNKQYQTENYKLVKFCYDLYDFNEYNSIKIKFLELREPTSVFTWLLSNGNFDSFEDLMKNMYIYFSEYIDMFVSFVKTLSKSDTNIYENYYISKHKPELNKSCKEDDETNLTFPEIEMSNIYVLYEIIGGNDNE